MCSSASPSRRARCMTGCRVARTCTSAAPSRWPRTCMRRCLTSSPRTTAATAKRRPSSSIRWPAMAVTRGMCTDMSAHSVEDIKRGSGRLRGTLLASLADAVTGALREDDQTLIKYHGSYQQDDRDVREPRRLAKLEPAFSFMIRTRTPGGVITPAQWLQLDAIASRYAERGLRITTRQAFQFHGVIKRELKATMQAINA